MSLAKLANLKRNKSFKCQFCRKVCKGGQGLAAHLRSHDPISGKKLKRKYTRKAALLRLEEIKPTPQDIHRGLVINSIQALLESLR